MISIETCKIGGEQFGFVRGESNEMLLKGVKKVSIVKTEKSYGKRRLQEK